MENQHFKIKSKNKSGGYFYWNKIYIRVIFRGDVKMRIETLRS